MKDMHRWALLDRLAAAGVLRLPQGVYAGLGERLREAMCDKDPASIGGLADQLAELILRGGREAAPEAARAARHEPDAAGTPSGEAYTLGQLSFAHLLAARIAERRVSADFEELLAGKFAPYVAALHDEDMTGVQLAQRLGHAVETISRNLKTLRDMGAVDYRREGTSFINFLTPAARHVAERMHGRPDRTPLAPAVQGWVREATRGLPKLMLSPPDFAAGGDRVGV